MTNFTRRTALKMAAAAATVPATATMAQAQTTHTIRIANFSFNPADITIAAGDTITWVNDDSTRHSATDLNGAFDTGLLSQGQSASLTFGGTGTFKYRCTPHGNMRGTITIA